MNPLYAFLAAAAALLAFSPGSREPEPGCIPVQQSLLDRDALRLPEPLVEQQMGGRLA